MGWGQGIKKYFFPTDKHRLTQIDKEQEISKENFSRIEFSPEANKKHPSSSVFICGQNSSSDLWALRDVSFEVKRGEVLGIIGRNGAGKSTLLKILSRITEPTSGLAIMRGRVGSLLEVGTGFHPELSGRYNIFLNGAISLVSKA